jgi:tetratricopeptide (TPR) repeat protein
MLLKMLVLSASIFLFPTSEQVAAQSIPTQREELRVGIKLLEEQRIPEAVKFFKRATSRNQDDGEAWYYLGLAYVRLINLKEATKAFETAVRLQPNSAKAHYALSDAFLRQGRLLEADSEAYNSLSLQPDNPYAYYIRAFVSFRFGSKDDAIKQADFAIQQKSDFAEAYLLKAQALLGFYSEAQSSRDQGLKDNYMARYRSASDPLTKYVQLVPDSENADIWRDALETLTNFSLIESSGIRTGREVTTKARILSKPEPTYTDEARQYQIQGTVILKAVFASDGTVKHIHILRALPAGLTEQTIRAAREIKFIPATLDSKAVSTWMQLEYNFGLF